MIDLLSFYKPKYTAYLLLTLSVIGCGGGGGSGPSNDTNDVVGNTDEIDLNITTFEYFGNESQATVNSTNLVELGFAVSQVAKNIGLEDVMIPSEILASTREYVASKATTIDSSDLLCPVGGAASHQHNEARTINKYTYTDCHTSGKDRGLKYRASGRHVLVYDANVYADFSSIFDGEIIDEKGVTSSLHRTLRCTTESGSCQFVSDFYGDDGRIYRMSDIYRLSQHPGIGIDITGRAFDREHGYVAIETEINLSFDCPNNQPSVGKLTFTGTNNTMGSIEFINCSQYVLSNAVTSHIIDWQ
ncbi:MAG: hypothetical protein KZQ96_13345 [Candidatus Thiodiazotropha sp. (ex Lucinoma borealis)]|nr:hypothetical protein [Candidatus Thiodiazotropha sp. (ex Lucinoma borealis)]